MSKFRARINAAVKRWGEQAAASAGRGVEALAQYSGEADRYGIGSGSGRGPEDIGTREHAAMLQIERNMQTDGSDLARQRQGAAGALNIAKGISPPPQGDGWRLRAAPADGGYVDESQQRPTPDTLEEARAFQKGGDKFGSISPTTGASGGPPGGAYLPPMGDMAIRAADMQRGVGAIPDLLRADNPRGPSTLPPAHQPNPKRLSRQLYDQAQRDFGRSGLNAQASEGENRMIAGGTPEALAGMGRLVASAPAFVADWMQDTSTYDKADQVGKTVMELSGVGPMGRLKNAGVLPLPGPGLKSDFAQPIGPDGTRETYDPVTDASILALGTMLPPGGRRIVRGNLGDAMRTASQVPKHGANYGAATLDAISGATGGLSDLAVGVGKLPVAASNALRRPSNGLAVAPAAPRTVDGARGVQMRQPGGRPKQRPSVSADDVASEFERRIAAGEAVSARHVADTLGLSEATVLRALNEGRGPRTKNPKRFEALRQYASPYTRNTNGLATPPVRTDPPRPFRGATTGFRVGEGTPEGGVDMAGRKPRSRESVNATEQRILEMSAQGKRASDIADSLGYASEGVAKVTRSRMRSRLGEGAVPKGKSGRPVNPTTALVEKHLRDGLPRDVIAERTGLKRANVDVIAFRMRQRGGGSSFMDIPAPRRAPSERPRMGLPAVAGGAAGAATGAALDRENPLRGAGIGLGAGLAGGPIIATERAAMRAGQAYGDAMSGARREMFAGPKAKTADKGKLATAKEMKVAGDDRGAIRDLTGWWTGPDGKWRFEIPDHDMKLRAIGNGSRLDEVVEHPRLFEAYPALRKVKVQIGEHSNEPAALAHWDGNKNVIYISSKGMSADAKQLQSYILHEIAHAVQEIENRPYGLSGIWAERAGEVEAINVQKRAGMSDVERAAQPPWQTQTVDDADQVMNDLSDQQKRALIRGIGLTALGTAGTAAATAAAIGSWNNQQRKSNGLR